MSNPTPTPQFECPLGGEQSKKTAKAAVVHIDASDGSEDVAEAVRATPGDTEDAVRDMQEDEAMTRQALDLLSSRRNDDAYQAAVETLRVDTRAWWAQMLVRGPGELNEGEESATADAEGCEDAWNVVPLGG